MRSLKGSIELRKNNAESVDLYNLMFTALREEKQEKQENNSTSLKKERVGESMPSAPPLFQQHQQPVERAAVAAAPVREKQNQM